MRVSSRRIKCIYQHQYLRELFGVTVTVTWPCVYTVVDGCNNPTNPCQNGGTCYSQLSQFTCICPPGFTGNVCQTTTQACASSPCLNGGSCSGTSTTFTCSCPAGFTGNQCQTRTYPIRHVS